MIISEAIVRLTTLQERHGDLKIVDPYNNEPEFKFSPGAESEGGEDAVIVE